MGSFGYEKWHSAKRCSGADCKSALLFPFPARVAAKPPTQNPPSHGWEDGPGVSGPGFRAGGQDQGTRATLSLPLERIYQKGFVMAPYAVVVDPYRAMQSLGVEGELLFSPDVNYIYRKQLEEAEIIVINKVDVISPERLAGLRAALEREYPETRIMEIASRDGTGVEALFDILGTETGKTRQVMEMDYER